ncbi:MAG: adenylate/guanylate cyclase domain-containing protein [Candidatus Puniceispirillales bacterium]
MVDTDPKLVSALAQAEILRDETDPDDPRHAVLTSLIEQARLGQKRLNRLIRRSDATEEKLFEANRKMETLTVSLSRFVPQTVVNALMRGEGEQLAGVSRKNLTVFFSDIVGFTTIASRQEPEPLAELLMDYFTAMTEVCNDHGGTLDQFIGDAILVFFGDPQSRGTKQDAAAAVSMALAMQERLDGLRLKWHDQGFSQNIHVRMGISTGYCHVGNFGSSSRLHYTVIGNTANEASRIQGLAKPDTVLVSNETWLLVRDQFDGIDHGETQLKGRDHPVRVYEVTGTKGESTDSRITRDGDGFHLRVDPEKLNSSDDLITVLEEMITTLRSR